VEVVRNIKIVVEINNKKAPLESGAFAEKINSAEGRRNGILSHKRGPWPRAGRGFPEFPLPNPQRADE